MNFLMRAAFVLGGIFLGINLINYFVLGHTGDYLPGGQRMGEWKEAKIREACYPALESPERDELLPKLASNQHRVDWRELNRAKEMTAALNCYLVTHPNAVCERNNRAYIVDYINRYFAKFDEMIEVAKRYGDSGQPRASITSTVRSCPSPPSAPPAARSSAGPGRIW